jgi:hypothetical protein
VTIVKAVRLLRLRRFWDIFLGKGVKISSVMAVFKLFFKIVLGCHLMACVW